MRLLLVEDEARVASFLVKGFRGRGYHVDHVETGADALHHLGGDDGYDLMLLDLGLPDIDGLEVLSTVRERGLGLPVIVLTARDADREEGLRRGADEYLVKPVPFGRLLDCVQTLAA